MHDVEPASRFARPRDRVVNCGKLRFPRAGVEEVTGGGAFWIRELGGIFGVHQQDGIELRDSFHPFAQRLLITGGKFVDAAWAHERLEPDHAALRELLQAIEIARHEAAPKGEVDDG